MHCRMLADISWLSCVSRCFFASIFPTRATVLCSASLSMQCHPQRKPSQAARDGQCNWGLPVALNQDMKLT